MVIEQEQQARQRSAYWVSSTTVVIVQFIVVSLLVRNSYFMAEDLYMPGFLSSLPWSWETLSRSMFGHLMPGFVAVWKAVATVGSLSWPLAEVIIVMIHAALLVGTIRLLTALCGRRGWVPLLALAASLSLAVLTCAVWWGAALAPGVGAAAAVWVWDSTIRYLKHRSAARLVAVFATMTLAMCFGERQILTPVYLIGFVLIIGVPGTRTFQERWRSAVDGWPAWATMATVGSAFMLVYLIGDYRSESHDPASVLQMITYLGLGLVQGFLPSTVGVLPGVAPLALVWGATVVVIAGIIVVSWSSSRARHAWSWFFAVFILCQLPIAIGRVGMIGVEDAVNKVRYFPEVTLLFWIAVAVSVATLPRLLNAAARRVAIAAVACTTAASVSLWSWSTISTSTTSPGALSKRFFSELSNPDSVLSGQTLAGEVKLLDVPLPTKIIPSNMFPWTLADRIYPWVRPGVTMTNVVEGSKMLGLDGSAVAPRFRRVFGIMTATDMGCVEAGKNPLTVMTSTRAAPADAGTMVRLRLLTDGTSDLRVLSHRPDGSTWSVSNEAEPVYRVSSGESTLVVPVAPVTADAVLLRVEEGAQVCVLAADMVTPVYK